MIKFGKRALIQTTSPYSLELAQKLPQLKCDRAEAVHVAIRKYSINSWLYKLSSELPSPLFP